MKRFVPTTLVFSLLLLVIAVYYQLPRRDSNFLTDTAITHELIQNSVAITPAPTVSPLPLTLDHIFSSHERYSSHGSVTLVATGDIIPARVTDSRMRRNGFDYPFTQVSSLLQSGDVTLVNLEAPLISRCQLHLDGMRFCGEGPFAAAMARHGIDVATLENNHIGNYGQEGIMETKKFLKDAGISYATFHEPLYVTVKDITFGIVAVNGVGPRIDTAAFREVIVPVREKADIVIVAVHWGREYSYAPVSAPGIAWDSPREIGHFFIDSGVDLVIGNHPHWVQGVELYHGGFISYAHGNFIFDQEWSRETTEGVVGSYVFENKRLVDVVYTPVVITDYAQPRIVDGEQASRIISAMQNSSRAMVISE